jgi:hypothetical protein
MTAQELFEYLAGMDGIDRKTAQVTFKYDKLNTYPVESAAEINCNGEHDLSDEWHSCTITELRLS